MLFLTNGGRFRNGKSIRLRGHQAPLIMVLSGLNGGSQGG